MDYPLIELLFWCAPSLTSTLTSDECHMMRQGHHLGNALPRSAMNAICKLTVPLNDAEIATLKGALSIEPRAPPAHMQNTN